MTDNMMVFALLLNGMFIVGGIILIVMAMQQRTRKLEMAHRERMAMIERGLAPGPEMEPGQAGGALGRRGTSRYTTLGIAIIGIGLGLMLLVGVAGGAPEAAIGVGGAIVVLGGAFIVNGYLQRGAELPAPPPGTPSARTILPPRLGPTDPPGPMAP